MRQPAEKPQLPELIDLETVAQHLGVTPRHIRRLVAEKRIPYVKWGRLLRFDPMEIAQWVDASRRPAETNRRTPRVRSQASSPSAPRRPSQTLWGDVDLDPSLSSRR